MEQGGKDTPAGARDANLLALHSVVNPRTAEQPPLRGAAMNHQRTQRSLTACPEMKVFEPFRLDMVNLCLWRAEERMTLTPKAFDILCYLVERADRLVTHDELLEALWPETYVNPEGIRKYILEIRRVLGDRPKRSLFIETLPKRGYQFVAKVADGRMQPPSPARTGDSAYIAVSDPAPVQLNDGLERVLSGQGQLFVVRGAGSLILTLNLRQPGIPPAGPYAARDRCDPWMTVAVYVAPFSSPFERCQESQSETWAAIEPESRKGIGEGRNDKE
jgi:DNA-binding winged helix-turn-helix (wHTH) protein